MCPGDSQETFSEFINIMMIINESCVWVTAADVSLSAFSSDLKAVITVLLQTFMLKYLLYFKTLRPNRHFHNSLNHTDVSKWWFW